MTTIPPEKLLPHRVGLVERSPRLEELLKALVKEDVLFEYNVPASVRSSYADEQLVHYLRETYSCPSFVVEDSEQIKKYLGVGDRVFKRGEFARKEVVQPNMVGQFVEKGKSGMIKVTFKDNGIWELSGEKLYVAGKIGVLTDAYKEWKKHLPLAQFTKELDTNYYLGYAGEKQERTITFIPDGAEGLVVNTYKGYDRGIHIVWAFRRDVKQRSGEKEGMTWPKDWFGPGDVILARSNEVNFEQLYMKHIQGEG